ncbi:MAG: hypothetical protein RR710_09215, partial [Oscillospiraceae bacterium]
ASPSSSVFLSRLSMKEYAYPQLKEEVLDYVMSGNAIRHLASAELQITDNQSIEWHIPANKIFNRIPYTHLKSIVK